MSSRSLTHNKVAQMNRQIQEGVVDDDLNLPDVIIKFQDGQYYWKIGRTLWVKGSALKINRVIDEMIEKLDVSRPLVQHRVTWVNARGEQESAIFDDLDLANRFARSSFLEGMHNGTAPKVSAVE